MNELGGTVQKAVAFEDSASGVKSASSAGVHTFGMLTALSREQLGEAGAHESIRDFSDRALWDYLARVNAA
ncbi:hypothetical protein WS68_12580 [Burkholderia sp. TSV86]|nr:hypothetical protein WS68_12580 [Burkholderia sp. TSV86]